MFPGREKEIEGRREETNRVYSGQSDIALPISGLGLKPGSRVHHIDDMREPAVILVPEKVIENAIGEST